MYQNMYGVNMKQPMFQSGMQETIILT